MRAHLFVVILALGAALTGGSALADSLNPPLVGMSEHEDKAGIVSIRLPVTWSAVDENAGKGHLATWCGWYQKKTDQTPRPDQFIYVGFVPAYRHAELLRHFDDTVPGTFVEESIKRGDGWVQLAHVDEAQQSHFTVRYVEVEGGVLRVVAKNFTGFQQHIAKHTDAVLDTVRLVGEIPEHPLPPGYRAVQGDGVEIWTNGKSSNALKKAVMGFKEGWRIAKQLSEGERVAHEPPRMVFCKDKETYRALYEETIDASKLLPFGFPDRDRWAVAMLLADSRKKEFPLWARRYGALQYLRRHYGGVLPAWVEWGVSLRPSIELHKKGKIGKPHRDEIRMAKKAVKARRATLDQILALSVEEISGGLENAPYELWAWHFWFSEVADGELAGVAYRDYLETLRESGNVEEAEKAFDGIGKDAITAQFHEWVESWK
jgi:hypothetical protein